jgi:hypothetical protein
MGWPPPLKAPGSRTARLAGLGVAAVVLVAAGGYLLLPLAVRLFVRALDLTLSVGLWLASSASSGADAATILATIGRAALGALTSTWALVVLAAFVLVGAAALYGLQRLLGVEPPEEEEESSR